MNPENENKVEKTWNDVMRDLEQHQRIMSIAKSARSWEMMNDPYSPISSDIQKSNLLISESDEGIRCLKNRYGYGSVGALSHYDIVIVAVHLLTKSLFGNCKIELFSEAVKKELYEVIYKVLDKFSVEMVPAKTTQSILRSLK